MNLHQVIPQLAIFGRILLAALFGFTVGLEREARGQSAGERTFALVAAAAAAFAAFAAEVFPDTGGQILSGVAAGIGFLGIGIIWRSESGSTHGLTTAASVWATAAIGLMAGLGLYVTGLLASLLVLVILEFDRIPLLGRLHDRAAARAPKTDVRPASPPRSDGPVQPGPDPKDELEPPGPPPAP